MAYNGEYQVTVESGEVVRDNSTGKTLRIKDIKIQQWGQDTPAYVCGEYLDPETGEVLETITHEQRWEAGRFIEMVREDVIEFIPDPQTPDETYPWTAYGPQGQSIITVYARRHADAVEEIRNQLNRPGRRDYARVWTKSGQIVRMNNR